jgi:hypothetical protein
VAALAIALTAGAIVAFAALLKGAMDSRARAAAFASAGRPIDAEILSVRRGDGSERRVRYRYDVSGRTFEGSIRLRARDGLQVGGRLPVVYLPDTPGAHYVQARGIRQVPIWLVPIMPLGLVSGAMIAAHALLVQRRLVEDGRPAVASVTATKRVRHQHGSFYKVTYEFRAMSGSSRHGSYEVRKGPPELGTPVVVLYDRERPERNKRYPVSLARVATE